MAFVVIRLNTIYVHYLKYYIHANFWQVSFMLILLYGLTFIYKALIDRQKHKHYDICCDSIKHHQCHITWSCLTFPTRYFGGKNECTDINYYGRWTTSRKLAWKETSHFIKTFVCCIKSHHNFIFGGYTLYLSLYIHINMAISYTVSYHEIEHFCKNN